MRCPGTGKGCQGEGVGQSSSFSDHQGTRGQAQVHPFHLGAGVHTERVGSFPTAEFRVSPSLLSPNLEMELPMVLGSKMRDWWLDGRAGFAVVRSAGWWMLLGARGHRDQ